MGRRATNTEIRSIALRPDDKTPRTRTGPGTSARTDFVADIVLTRPELALEMYVRVRSGEFPQIRKLVVKSQPTLTSGMLHGVALDWLLREVIRTEEVRDIKVADDIALGDRLIRPDVSKSRAQRRADDLAARAAEIYLAALAGGSRAPAYAVSIKLDRSRSQVAIYIRRARELGLLPPLANGPEPHEGAVVR